MPILFLFFALLAPLAGAADYTLGERLQPNKSMTTPLSGYTEITWEALTPKGWDPAASFREMNLSRLKDSDPRAIAALSKLRKLWDEAPLEPSMNGKRIRLAGFAVPLERVGDDVSEFLLVPYFGACIHSPPPPANQTIHVFVKGKPRPMNTMDTVWVGGTLEVHRAESGLGVAGYRLQADSIRPYSKLIGTR